MKVNEDESVPIISELLKFGGDIHSVSLCMTNDTIKVNIVDFTFFLYLRVSAFWCDHGKGIMVHD